MNGISPLSSNLQDQTPREAATLSPGELGDSAKIGVKRPSQDEAQEAPELKKTNLDPDSMTIDAKSEPEDAFEMSSSEVNGPTVSYYCKYPDKYTSYHPVPTLSALYFSQSCERQYPGHLGAGPRPGRHGWPHHRARGRADLQTPRREQVQDSDGPGEPRPDTQVRENVARKLS